MVVVATSVVAVRRRLSYRVWHALHVRPTSRSRSGSATSSPPATSSRASPSPSAYWWALYAVTLAALVGLRIVLPVVRSLRHRLRIERVVPEAPGVVSVEIGGVGLDRLRVLSRAVAALALPRARALVGDAPVLAVGGARRAAAAHHGQGRAATTRGGSPRCRPGRGSSSRVPSGGLTSAARRRERVALIAGGVGIAPIRALLEDTPGEPGTIAVIYRAASEDDVLFRAELDELSRRRGAELHYVLGERRGDELLSAEHLQALVPDIASRDVYVCGPRSLTEAARTSLRRAGVSPRQIISEGFGW